MQNSSPKDYVKHLRLCGLVAIFIALIFTIMPVRADSGGSGKTSYFAPRTRIMLFGNIIGDWDIATFAQAEPGNEFFSNNQLFRVIDSNKAQVVLSIDAGRLFEADRPCDKTSKRPTASDVVQVLDKHMRCAEHALLSNVHSGTTIRFQGKAYIVATDLSLTDTKTAFSAAISTLQRIEITQSGLQHITGRHTVSGTQTAGKSIFSAGEDIKALIKSAELVTPVQEENGYLKRVFDAGRIIGVDGMSGKQTSTYRVITTSSGKLVTAYPVMK